ncbi:MAG: UPF0164 family protein [bacterium]|nr:MAG: UPF0164 family protein [bacterium]
MKIIKLLIIISALVSSKQVYAGKYAAEFLRIGVGSRALGMGGAFVAVADDGTASYWNPAGLASLRKHQVSFSHVQMFDNLAHHNFANLSFRIGNNLGLGISWIRLSVDDIPRYSELKGTKYDRFQNPDLRSTGIPEGYFGDIEDALFLSFGKGFDFDLAIGGGLMPTLIPCRLSFGVSYKYISQKLDTAEGTGQGMDIGIKISFFALRSEQSIVQRNLSFGLNLQDITGTTVLWNTSNQTKDQLPMNLLVGMSYSERFPWLNTRITFSMGRDNSYVSANHWGGEINFGEIFSLRIGIQNSDFTAGVGFKAFWFHVDYAFVSYELGNSHRISGAVEF